MIDLIGSWHSIRTPACLDVTQLAIEGSSRILVADRSVRLSPDEHVPRILRAQFNDAPPLALSPAQIKQDS